jgi:hypothetical protein
MARRSLAVFAGTIVILAAAGCNGSPSTTGTPSAQSTTSSTGQGLPYAGAPKVANPLPESVLSGDPCADALTPSQVKEALGVEVTGESGTTSGIGRKCDWSNADTTAVLTVFFVTEAKQGLSGVYANSKPQAVKWQPLAPIQGFPAVAYLTPGPDPKTFCTVTVGIADDLSVDVALALGRSAHGSVDPCSVAPKAADAVVTTLRQKAGA